MDSSKGFRRATFDDVLPVARLLRRLWTKIEPAYGGIQWDHESALLTVQKVVRDGLCMVGGEPITSCAGAVLYPFLWNYRENVADIVFWSFASPSGARVFEVLCDACRMAGATYIKANSHLPDGAAGGFYLRRGFAPAETSYLVASDKCCKARANG